MVATDGFQPCLPPPLDSLPSLTHKIEDLAQVEGWSPDSIARSLELSVEQVAEHLQSARAARQALAASVQSREALSDRQKRDAEILDRAMMPERPKVIACTMALTRDQVHAVLLRLHKRGHEIPAPHDSPLTAWSQPDLVQLLWQGLKIQEIAERLSVDSALIRLTILRLRRQGVSVPTRRGNHGWRKLAVVA